MSDRMIYLDNAATTRVREEVADAMLPYFTKEFGNASTLYYLADGAKNALHAARDTMAKILGCESEEIYFTGCGTESDNWAIKGTAEALCDKGNHIITTKIEHHAVLHTCQWLERHGAEVTYLDVDEAGMVRPAALEAAIRPNTILISVMFANNEIGTMEPVRQIGEIARRHGILFHTDAVQAFCQVPISVRELHIDMLSASAHKLNGPKGVGLLYVRKGVELPSFMHGGGQEKGKRAGTENVAGIVGFGKAAALAYEEMQQRMERETELRDHLIDRVLREIPFSRLNGSWRNRLPGNTNFSFQFADGETMLVMLDMEGICAAAGSACTTGQSAPSHVLSAIGLPDELARGSLRLTLGYETTKEEIDYTADCLKEIVEKLQSMSPACERIRGQSRSFCRNGGIYK